MGAVKLEVRCPQNVNGIALEPDPDWSFQALLSELDSLEKRLSDSSPTFAKTKSREFYEGKSQKRSPNAFVMRVWDDDIDDSEDERQDVHDQGSLAIRRFNCYDLYLSDSDDEPVTDVQSCLMTEVGLVEGALFELSYEHQLGVKEEIRSRISVLETDLLNETEKSTSAHARVEKYREARREAERKLDVQYQRKIAEALDDHLTAVQRDHELKSQIEERRIRSDAAYEEAKRKEKALQEERLRQEKAKAEAEMQAKLRAEEAKRIALEAERKAAAEREATKMSNLNASVVSKGEAVGLQKAADSRISDVQSKKFGSDGTKKLHSAGDTLRAAESALKLEQERLQKFKELNEKNQLLLTSRSNEDFNSNERKIARFIKQIAGTKENVSTKATELIKIFNDPRFPQSVSAAAFAKKVVNHNVSVDHIAFACGYVIVLVTSQFPYTMDLLLTEFHRACIYTVPKHVVYTQSAFESKEAYYKAVGYQEDDGKIESTKDYLKRLDSYMRLYGALVQTEIEGVPNLHGLNEGWAWLARFLNALPANIYTAVALNAFLQMAGYALFRRYKNQFTKIIEIVSDNFLNALRAREDSELNPIILEIQSYIQDKKFLKQPEGRTLRSTLLSSSMVPEKDYPESYHQAYRDYY